MREMINKLLACLFSLAFFYRGLQLPQQTRQKLNVPYIWSNQLCHLGMYIGGL